MNTAAPSENEKSLLAQRLQDALSALESGD